MLSLHAFLYALAAGLLPSLFWLWFWLREDRLHPEPRSLIAGTFLGGALAVFIAIFAEKWIADVVSDTATRYIWWAAFEESIKFVTVAVIALHTRYNDEPVDAMVYCITVALGFAALENTLFILGPLSGGYLAQSIVTGNMRFIGATLVHVVSSAFIGFTLGWAFYRGWFVRIIAFALGLSGAIALHAAFNLSIINTQADDTLRAFGWVWGAVVLLIILFEEVKAVHPRIKKAKG
jgi:RsiW-degrading membrane proteinase PrsW (M82 family)